MTTDSRIDMRIAIDAITVMATGDLQDGFEHSSSAPLIVSLIVFGFLLLDSVVPYEGIVSDFNYNFA